MPSFSAPDGVEIVFDDHPGDGPAVVLHHGFAADARTNWDAPGITGHLVDAGRRVVALDARGHGRSGKPHDPAAYDAPAMARDVSALLDHLDLGEVDLVGYSMGAFVSLEVATRDDRLRSLTLGGIGAGALPRRDGGTGPAIDREAVAVAMEADDPSAAQGGGRAFRALADATGADRQALAAVLRSSPHRPDDVGSVSVPVLVVAGLDDPLAAGVDELASAFSRSRLVRVPGDHMSAVGTPEMVDALLRFVTDPGAEVDS
ncbi:alpha/beta fold hydrolase [Actinomarinicola tropica]|uniref:Alpha/beta fold hydrolase n=1 Tax=Actinomarinicola tropica TaxID=2789776 RepID=A0A5Q2RRU7_9ACTN|nr:alpha/beta fold hydrolase [Actinomarinicola tropica]QGG96877.1 alpha/beta fold hydrolase [Actinomarinicola tropica]